LLDQFIHLKDSKIRFFSFDVCATGPHSAEDFVLDDKSW